VQFVDGDCEVVDGWLDRARRELERRPDVAVVCGRRRERFPEKSVYNRLADVEWDTPIGEAKSCGGDAMFRAGPFREAGGFDPSVVAGEEPELCQRLREKGWKVLRIDAEMTVHDSALLRFGQWWKRSVRSGYGAMDVVARFRRGKDGLFVKQVAGARTWAIGWTAGSLSFALLSGLIAWTYSGTAGSPQPVRWGLAAALLALLLSILVFGLQVVRLAAKVRRRVPDWSTALGYGALTMLGKFANVAGQYRYFRDRAAGRNTRMIEYKTGAPASAS
jgi:cellulose synthase/poly-beta-1,6-N-acetylglucosamine synthase-like glycosyltransferase